MKKADVVEKSDMSRVNHMIKERESISSAATVAIFKLVHAASEGARYPREWMK